MFVSSFLRLFFACGKDIMLFICSLLPSGVTLIPYICYLMIPLSSAPDHFSCILGMDGWMDFETVPRVNFATKTLRRNKQYQLTSGIRKRMCRIDCIVSLPSAARNGKGVCSSITRRDALGDRFHIYDMVIDSIYGKYIWQSYCTKEDRSENRLSKVRRFFVPVDYGGSGAVPKSGSTWSRLTRMSTNCPGGRCSTEWRAASFWTARHKATRRSKLCLTMTLCRKT